MCGFAGIIRSVGTERERLASDVRRMSGLLRHRGPDDAGEWIDASGRVAFAFRRLAILDLSAAGHQPMVSRSGRYTIVFNGEVYNFESLRSAVGLPRQAYQGGSDTEVILAAFEHFGIRDTLPRLIGMFAIALWDEAEGELWLIRDRLGIKPLYLARTAGGFAFASELGALTRAAGFDETLDPGAIAAYLRYLYIPAPATPYRSAWKLPPGHFLRIRNPGDSLPPTEAYWSLGEVRDAGRVSRDGGRGARSDAEAVDALDALLSDAVRLRMIADVPLGALLSGGIDSSLVVAMMGEHTHLPVQTFTIGFDDPAHDESTHAAAVARHLGTDHTELRVTGRDALDLVPRLPEIFDEPLADPSQIPTYLVSALARKSVTVALSGDGGDELFGGYNRYRFGPSATDRLHRIPTVPRRWLGRALASLPAPAWDRLAALGGLHGAPRLAGQKTHKLARLLRTTSRGESYRCLLSSWDDPERFLVGSSAATAPDAVAAAIAGSADPLALDEMLLLDQRYYLPDDLLQKVDRASMAVSLEVRVPILDHRVVEESWRLRAEQKIRGDRGKWILRELLDRRVPRELIERPKTGFSVPVEGWLAGPLKGWAEELLLAKCPDRDELLDAREVGAAWSAFLKGRTELALGIWSLVMLEAWRRRWGAEAPSVAGAGVS